MSEQRVPYGFPDRSGAYTFGVDPATKTATLLVIYGPEQDRPHYVVDQAYCLDCQMLLERCSFDECPYCGSIKREMYRLETDRMVIISEGHYVWEQMNVIPNGGDRI